MFQLDKILHLINTLTPIVGLLIIIGLGGLSWSQKKLYELMDREYVRKDYCFNCVENTKQFVLSDSRKKYEDVLNKIERNHEKTLAEIKEIRENDTERVKAVARMEGKLDFLISKS